MQTCFKEAIGHFIPKKIGNANLKKVFSWTTVQNYNIDIWLGEYRPLDKRIWLLLL